MTKPEIVIPTRVGISKNLVAQCHPCEHGAKWHLSIENHNYIEVCYPNCEICFAEGPRPKREDYEKQWQFSEALSRWNKTNRSQQVAATNSKSYRANLALPSRQQICKTLPQLLDETVELVKTLGLNIEFSDKVEAYMYYRPSTSASREYDYVAYDVHRVVYVYDVDLEALRDVVSGEILFRFMRDGDTKLFPSAAGHEENIHKALEAYRQQHVQRAGKKHSRTWLVWLLNGYILDSTPEQAFKWQRSLHWEPAV